jgi:hypothetical protein
MVRPPNAIHPIETIGNHKLLAIIPKSIADMSNELRFSQMIIPWASLFRPAHLASKL